ncbi:hypothetical protein JXC34_01380, partial [Candidatus Woesearchaeota archaeon]|nr:hypothetical protein [Candidatus Woesearchaeota archaeon]
MRIKPTLKIMHAVDILSRYYLPYKGNLYWEKKNEGAKSRKKIKEALKTIIDELDTLEAKRKAVDKDIGYNNFEYYKTIIINLHRLFESVDSFHEGKGFIPLEEIALFGKGTGDTHIKVGTDEKPAYIDYPTKFVNDILPALKCGVSSA